LAFNEFIGNQRIVAALRGMLAAGRVPHALLFTGPRGIGKYTLARMFAQAASCERLTDDFCGECATCLRIAELANPQALIERALAERGESADAAAVERMPLLLQPHPDVCVVVPDPVRLKTPVARPVLHVGQLRAVQRAAYFRPEGRRRVFILDGAETMRWDYANIFLKILEEPPESATLILLAPSPFALLSTIRSRCLQFHFAPLETPQVEEILRERSEMSAAARKLAAQLSEGSPGAALGMEPEAAIALRRDVLTVIDRAARPGAVSDLFSRTAQLAKQRELPFEQILEVFYSLLSDLLELSWTGSHERLRNSPLRKELEALAKHVDTAWIAAMVRGVDGLSSRLRRNINRQLALDAVATAPGLRGAQRDEHFGAI
jgi:DNA polymerase III subunit delta'